MIPLNIHYFQHVPFEGLGMMEDWFLDRGHRLSRTAFYQDQPCWPSIHDIDWLVVMGGPMAVYDQAQYPWLTPEKQFIKQFIQTGKPVLGICLGAQLIASALGARVYASGKKEIGWFPVQFQPEARNFGWVPQNSKEEVVFHWHGDTFELPPNSRLLASSELTPHQGFVYGSQVVALQFHLEVDRPLLESFLVADASELTGERGTQTPDQARSGCVAAERTKQILVALLADLECRAQG